MKTVCLITPSKGRLPLTFLKHIILLTYHIDPDSYKKLQQFKDWVDFKVSQCLGPLFYLTYLYFFSSLRDKFLNVIFKIFFGPFMAEILKETYQNVKAEKVFLKNAIALFLFLPRHDYFLITVFING